MDRGLICERIKNVREDLGLSQEEFGKLLGISKQSICSWEKGRSMPDIFFIMKIAEIGGCTTDSFLSSTLKIQEPSTGYFHLSSQEKKLLIKLRTLAPKQRQAVETIIESLKIE